MIFGQGPLAKGPLAKGPLARLTREVQREAERGEKQKNPVIPFKFLEFFAKT